MRRHLGDAGHPSRQSRHAAPARLAEPRRGRAGDAEKNYGHLHETRARETAAAQENVLFSLDNLHSYPCVQDRLMGGTLRLHGWFFKIATAELFAYDPESRQFTPLVSE
jgi:carbonic anhydrase